MGKKFKQGILETMETCVFGKQSSGPGHCDLLGEEVPLLLKLQSYFAEFLRESFSHRRFIFWNAPQFFTICKSSFKYIKNLGRGF
jgi:hypothetical protein